MITIITGVPGMGKTASTIHALLQNDKSGFNARPVFVMGVPDLLLDHSKVPPISEWTEQRADPDDPSLMLDYYTFPPNSILWIDEGQRVFPSRTSGSKVPPHVSALATHRHTGLDIWISTQKPMQLDNWCRELAGRHIHLKNTILGRRLFEWPEYQDPNSKANLSEAIKRKFSPPKEVFSLYKSAEAHTKQPRRIHQAWFILMFLFIFIAFMGYKVYNGLYKRVTGQSDPFPAANAAEVLNPAEIALKAPAPVPVAAPLPVAQPVQPMHPFKGYDFKIKGVIKSARMNRTYYELRQLDNVVFTNSDELIKLGYSITQHNDCSS